MVNCCSQPVTRQASRCLPERARFGTSRQVLCFANSNKVTSSLEFKTLLLSVSRENGWQLRTHGPFSFGMSLPAARSRSSKDTHSVNCRLPSVLMRLAWLLPEVAKSKSGMRPPGKRFSVCLFLRWDRKKDMIASKAWLGALTVNASEPHSATAPSSNGRLHDLKKIRLLGLLYYRLRVYTIWVVENREASGEGYAQPGPVLQRGRSETTRIENRSGALAMCAIGACDRLRALKFRCTGSWICRDGDVMQEVEVRPSRLVETGRPKILSEPDKLGQIRTNRNSRWSLLRRESHSRTLWKRPKVVIFQSACRPLRQFRQGFIPSAELQHSVHQGHARLRSEWR